MVGGGGKRDTLENVGMGGRGLGICSFLMLGRGGRNLSKNRYKTLSGDFPPLVFSLLKILFWPYSIN
jgi:hypothetical protein